MTTWEKSIGNFLIAALLFFNSGCIKTQVTAQTVATPTANSSVNLLTKDELYFGLSKPAGEMISQSQWQGFVNSVITPRFKEGLTVIDAYGQFLNSKGQLVTEKTKVVILVYENSPEKSRFIEEIIATYKQKFHQESVLRVTSSVKASF
jgi:Protein of unknown function (DUF3574)